MQAPLPPALTNRKPASISMMVWRTVPRLNRRPALRANPCSPAATADRCSASSRLSPPDLPMSRPSWDNTTACSTWATRSTRSFTSQVMSTVVLGRWATGSAPFFGAGFVVPRGRGPHVARPGWGPLRRRPLGQGRPLWTVLAGCALAQDAGQVGGRGFGRLGQRYVHLARPDRQAGRRRRPGARNPLSRYPVSLNPLSRYPLSRYPLRRKHLSRYPSGRGRGWRRGRGWGRRHGWQCPPGPAVLSRGIGRGRRGPVGALL